MALELLVFDGKLHGDRKNWACPLGQCKDNFDDAKTLMRHVSNCEHFPKGGFPGGKVYCNSCGGHDCFTLQVQHDAACEDARERDGKRVRAKRRLSSLTDFLTRSRSGSRASSPGIGPGDNPSPISSRHGVFSTLIPSPSPGGRARKRSALYTPPPMSTSFEPGAESFQIGGCHEMDSSAALIELPTLEKPKELAAPEDPRIAEAHAWRDQHVVSAMSEDAYNSSMFADLHNLTESPTEDISMESRMPDWHMDSGYGSGASGDSTNSRAPFPPADSYNTGLQHHVDKHQPSSWDYQQPTTSGYQADALVSPASTRDELYFGNTAPSRTSSYGDVAMNDSAYVRPAALVASGRTAATRPRQPRTGSGDSLWSNSTFESHQSGSSSMPTQASESLSTEDLHCPYPGCTYQPTGIRANLAMYLSKHINNQHKGTKVSCSGCGKEFKRPDNLKTHQRNSCPMTQSPGTVGQASGWARESQMMEY